MTEFTVIAYEKEDGESPVEDFINGLDVKMRAKMYGLLSILQEKGNTLRDHENIKQYAFRAAER